MRSDGLTVPNVLRPRRRLVAAERLGEAVVERLARLQELVHHDHVHVRRRRRERGLHLVAPLDDVDAPADQHRRLGELLLEVRAVDDEDQLDVVEVARSAQHAPDEHHGQRLAGALRVPDDAAALGRRLPLAQACHDPARRAVLLVAGDDLDPLAVRAGP